jgi:hypothetical protein
VVGDVVEEGSLPHAGFAANDESPTLAITNGVDEAIEFVAFSPPAEQLHGAPPGRELTSPEEPYARREMSFKTPGWRKWRVWHPRYRSSR